MLSVAKALVSVAALTCEEGKVPDVNQMCIKPRYIEGCAQYSTPETCNKCEFSIDFVKVDYKRKRNGLCEYSRNQLRKQCCLRRDNFQRCSECELGLFLN